MAHSPQPAAPPNGAGELLQLLRDQTPRTRAELAKLTGLARSTVGARVDALLASGLLAPSGEAASTGGRPPVRFAFNPEARVVVGADLGATHGRIALTDLTGRPLCEIGEDLEITDGPEIVLDWVTSTTSRMLELTGSQPPTTSSASASGCPAPSSTRAVDPCARRSCPGGTTTTCRPT